MNLASRTPWTLSALALTGLCLAGNVDAQGLTARLAPETSTFRWNESIGLEDATLFGGGASLGFGRYVFLRASYKRASSVRTSLAAAGYGGPTVEENSVGASLFSTDVQIRLGAGPIAPVLVGGGGVLGLSPDARDDVRQIEASFGAGIDARLFSWLDGQLLLQDVRFRLDRSNIAGNALNAPEPDPDRDDLRRSLALTASLGARFGGGRSSARADRLDSDMGSAVSGGERLLIPVEVQAGVVRFDNALAIGDQPIAGLRAGLDFGPYFGLRGSYAGGLGRRSGMSTWSGEAQFNMGRVTTMSPHLLLGFGQMKFSGAFLDENGLLPEDKDALILGAGIGVPVGGRSRFVVSLRDYVTSPVAASVASTTADLRHNFSLSAGLSYLVRGRRRVGGPTGPALGPIPDGATVAQAAPPNTVSARPSPSDATDAATTASQATAGGVSDLADAPSPGAAAAPGQPAEGQSATAAGSITYHSDRVVSIPIPTQGELYIRYGPSPAPSANATAPGPTVATPQLQTAGAAGAPTDSSVVLQLIREEVARSLAASSSGVTRADLEMLEVRIQNRLSASLEQLAQARPTDSSLSRQVEELTQLMRQRADEAPSQTLPIALITSEGSLALANESRAPFLRGAAFRFGSASVRDSRTGIGASGDVMVGSLVSGRLRPYVSVHAGRAGVRGTLGSAPYRGHVVSLGGGAGVTLDLPSFRSLAPALNVGLVGVGGGVSGDTPSQSTVIEGLYGGFVMGPRVSADASWNRSPDARWSLTSSLSRTWAGSRGGWSFQVGMRWLRRGVSTDVRPLFVRTVPPEPAASPSVFEESAVEAQPIAEPVNSGAPIDSTMLARVNELERALESERQSRLRSESIADSARTSAGLARARADSLAAISVDAASRLREREDADASRVRLREELENLVGVVDNVQSVRRTERGLEVALGGGLFPIGSVRLEGTARSRIERVARVLARSGAEGYAFLVDGHTDSSGSEETNELISRQRAEAVRSVLLSVGISPSRVGVLASGEGTPIANNDTAEGRGRNRRVEIVILGF